MLFCGSSVHGIINPVPIRMKPYSILVVLFLSIILVSISGCTFDSGNSPSQTQTVNTIVAGQILDETGTPVPNAEVSVGSAKTSTTLYGTFMLTNLNVPSDRVVVKAVKDGYFTAFRAEEPKSGKITQIILRMMSNAPQGNFSASSGKTLTLGNNASVVFPANGYVTTSGAAYTGNVNYVVKHLDPESGTFYDNFVGDFQGRSSDGSIANLLSYGVLRVELTGIKGEKLNLAKGSTAKLSVPIPTSMQSYAPSTLPLWSFDETLGMWKEESVATKTGNTYTGYVSHFSDWNFDAKGDTASLVIKVVCNNEIVPGVTVRVGERKVVSDEGTINIRRVPCGIKFKVKVYAEDNGGLESNEYEVGSYVNGQVDTLTVLLTTCPAYITGTLQNCENQPTDGTIVGEYANNLGYFCDFVRKGLFKIHVISGVAITLKGYTNDGRESDLLKVPSLALNNVYNAGLLNACKGNIIFSNDFDLGSSTLPYGVISQDGEKYFVLVDKMLKTFNTSNGSLFDEFSVNGTNPELIEVSIDGATALVRTGYDVFTGLLVFETYNINTHKKLAQSSFLASWTHLSPDGSKVIAFIDNRTIKVYVASDFSVVKDITTIYGNPIEKIWLFSDFVNKKEFIVADGDVIVDKVKLHVIDCLTGYAVRSFVSDIDNNFASISEDGSIVLVPKYSGKVQGAFYNINTGKKVSSIKYASDLSDDYSIYKAAITSDNQYATIQFINNSNSLNVPTLAIYQVVSGVLIKALPIPPTKPLFEAISYSADGTKLAGLYKDANGNYKVRIWKF